MTSEKRQQIKNQQKELQLLFSAWMNKKKHEVLAFADKDGNLVEHYPDGSKQVVLIPVKR